jgi:hypothetical protein
MGLFGWPAFGPADRPVQGELLPDPALTVVAVSQPETEKGIGVGDLARRRRGQLRT